MGNIKVWKNIDLCRLKRNYNFLKRLFKIKVGDILIVENRRKDNMRAFLIFGKTPSHIDMIAPMVRKTRAGKRETLEEFENRVRVIYRAALRR